MIGFCLGGLCQGGLCQVNPPGRSMGPATETPLQGTWDQAARQEVTWYRNLPPPMDRMTDTNENNTLPQTSFASGKNLKWSKNVQNPRLLALCCAFVVSVLNKYGCTVCKQRTTIIHCFKLSWEGNVTRFLVDWRKVNFLMSTTL